jgi:hypothetical protein
MTGLPISTETSTIQSRVAPAWHSRPVRVQVKGSREICLWRRQRAARRIRTLSWNQWSATDPLFPSDVARGYGNVRAHCCACVCDTQRPRVIDRGKSCTGGQQRHHGHVSRPPVSDNNNYGYTLLKHAPAIRVPLRTLGMYVDIHDFNFNLSMALQT